MLQRQITLFTGKYVVTRNYVHFMPARDGSCTTTLVTTTVTNFKSFRTATTKCVAMYCQLWKTPVIIGFDPVHLCRLRLRAVVVQCLRDKRRHIDFFAFIGYDERVLQQLHVVWSLLAVLLQAKQTARAQCCFTCQLLLFVAVSFSWYQVLLLLL